MTLLTIITGSVPAIRFTIIASTHYTGPGEIKVLDNPGCDAKFCAMACFAHFSECRVANLNKKKCQCHLYDKTFYANSVKKVTDIEWDLLSSFYRAG